MANNVDVGLKFKTTYEGLDAGKQDLKELKNLMDSIGKDGVKLNLKDGEIEQAKLQISALERSIREAEQSGGDFGRIFQSNLNAVQNEAKQTATSVSKVEKEIKSLNQTSNNGGGFKSISNAARLATKEIQGTTGQIDQLRVNLQQGMGQTIAFGAIGAVTGAVTDALNVTKQLDEISTDISIVSGKTRKEMEGYRDAAVDAADALGTTTKDYLDASLIFEQQGGQAAYYAKELAEATVTAANISNVATDQMSEYLTATINGFQLLKEKGGEAGTYITDVMAKLGAASGSDLAEIATGLTRTANTAKDVGFEFEEIATMIATVSEVTRRTPETIGNAFKSMLTSFTQLREAGEEEVEAFTNKVQEAFKLGGIEDISLFDNGNLRDASDIFKDIAARWQTMNKEQQSLVSEAVAGKYQAETFRAFMNNQERYNQLLGEAYDSAGTSAQQQLVYMDSLKAKGEQLQNAWQGAVNTVVDSDMFKGVLEDATNFLKIIGDAKSGLGGLATAIAPIIGIGGQMFGANQIGELYSNNRLNKQAKEITASLEKLKVAQDGNLTALQEEYKSAAQVNQIMSTLGPEAAKNYEEVTKEITKLDEKLKDIPKSAEEVKAKAKETADLLIQNGGYKGVDEKNVTRAAKRLEEKQDPRLLDNIKQLNKAKEELEKAQQKFSTLNDKISLKDRSGSNKVNRLQKELTLWEKDYSKIISENKSFSDQFSASMDKIRESIKQQHSDSLELSTVRKQALEIENQIRNSMSAQKPEAAEKVAQAQKELDKKAKQLVLEEQYTNEMKEQNKIIADRKVLEDKAQSTAQIAKRTELIQKGVRGMSLAYSTIVPIIATYNSVQEKSISKQDGVIAGLQTTSAMLMASMNPWGMAAGAAAGAFSLIVDKFDLFKSRGEKAKEVNDQLTKTFMSLQETVSGNISNLNDIADTYKRFEGVNAEAFINNAPDPSDTEAFEKYNKNLEDYDNLAGKIAQTNPELVKGYDDTGRAIIDLSKDFETLMEQQKTARTDNYQMLSANRNSFIVQQVSDLQDAKSNMNDYSVEVAKLTKELEKAKKQGNGEKVDDILKDLTNAQNKISEVQKTFSETKANIQSSIVVPFNEANDEFNKLVDKAPELKEAFETFSDTYMNSNFLAGMASENDEEGMKNLVQNMGLIKDKFTEIAQQDPGKAQEFLDKIAKSSEWAKLALYDVQGNIETLQEKMAEAANPITDGAQSRALKFVDKIIPEEDVKKAQKRIGKLASDLEEKVEDANKMKFGFSKAEGADFTSDRKEIENINDKIKDYDKLQSTMYDVSEEYARTSRTVEGFNENLGNVQDLDTAMEALKNLQKNGFDDSQLEILKQKFPELEKSMRVSAEKGTEAFQQNASNLYAYLSEEQQAAVRGMVTNNQQFYTNWMENNSETINKIAEDYGIDAANYQTLGEYKNGLQSLSLENLQVIAGQEIETNNEKNKEILAGEAVHVSNMISLTDIWSNSNLTYSQKLVASFLNAYDDMSNGLGNALSYMEQLIKGWFNTIHKALGDFLGGMIKKLPKGMRDALGLDEIDKWGEGGISESFFKKLAPSTLAKDYVDKKNQEAQDEQEKKDSLIQQILEGKFKNSNGLSNEDLMKKLNLDKPQSLEGLNGVPRDPENKDVEKDGKIEKEDKDKDKKDVDNLELELDRYYKLDHILSEIEKRYSELSDAKDAAYGNDRLNIMKQEEQLLAQKAGVLKQYTAELNKEQDELRNKLASQGFSFSANGDIDNLNQRLTDLQNAANSKTGDAKEDAIDAVKKIQEEASRYQDITFNLIPDKQKTLNEIKKQLSEIARERIEYTVKLRVDKDEFKSDVLDVVKEMQDSYADLDEKAQIVGKQMKQALDNVSYWQSMMNQVRNDRGLTDSDRQDLLQEYNKNLLDAVSKARSGYKELLEVQADFVKQSIEAINKVNDRYDNLFEKAGQLAAKTEELYGTKAYGKIVGYFDTQEKAINGQVKNLQEAQRRMIKYRNSVKQGSDAWNEANDAINEMADSISDALLKKLELAQKRFELFTQSVEDGFQKMFGTWGLDGVIDDFDKLTEKQDKYFSNFEKFTNISSKIKEINDEIAKTQDPKRAKELADFRDKELSALLAQDKVSQDDYDRAMKMYDIKQKELALQERENAKRTAQLVRDANGNMTYEYVRTETEDLSSEIADLQKQKDELYAFDSDKVKESAKGVFDTISKYQDKIKELQDKGLDPAQYKKELQKLLNEAEGEIKDKTNEMNKWLENAGKDGLSNLQGMISNGTITPDQLGVDKNTLSSIFSAMKDGTLTVQDMLSGDFDDFANSIGMTADQLSGTMDKLLELILGDNMDIAAAMMDASNKWTSTAQQNVNNLGNAYAEYMSQATKVLNDYSSSTGRLNDLLNQTNQASQQVISTIDKQTQAMLRSQRQTDATSNSVLNLQNRLIGSNGNSGLFGSMVQLQRTMNEQLQPSMVNTGKQTDILSGKTYNSAVKYNTMGNEARFAYQRVNAFSDQPTKVAMSNIDRITGKTNNTAGAFRNVKRDANEGRNSIIDFSSAISTLAGYGSYKVSGGSTKKAASLDSGGYTGTWSNSTNNAEGRMAILHEKELILNKEDTKNILESVKMQRGLMESIKGRGSSVKNSIQNMSSNISNIQNSNRMSTVEQNITLSPNFPNARDRSEIEAAFEGLLGKASTYVGKK